MKPKVVHYNNALNPNTFAYAACMARGNIKTTKAKADVTCRRCLKMIEKREEMP